jgi:hypothetical protein
VFRTLADALNFTWVNCFVSATKYVQIFSLH